MVFNQGLGGPKTKPKGVADGQSVNILTLRYISIERRSTVLFADYWISRFCTKVNQGANEDGFVRQRMKARFQEKSY